MPKAREPRLTDMESIVYLREWGLHDCWNPKMQEAVATVCDKAECAEFNADELDQLEWLLTHTIGRRFQFLKRLMPQKPPDYVPRVVFENLIHQGKDGRP